MRLASTSRPAASDAARQLPPVGALLPQSGLSAFCYYAVLTLAFTWPLALGLTRDIPRDLGDSLLNSWILGWNGSHLLRAAGGDLGALGELWHGNIFHPARYTLAYSELMLAQSVLIAPLYGLTDNLVLCYNVLFLATFILSGLGMFLLVRAYGHDWRVAFVAGAFYAFTPYRVNQGPHIQVMTSQWLPFVLLGFHRFVTTRRALPLVGGTVALIAQNLSCGYFMLFFAPFVPLFVLFEIGRCRAWRDLRVWGGLSLAAIATAAVTIPSMYPYVAARAIDGPTRSLEEIRLYSADAWSWLSADDNLRFWGSRLRLLVKPEGQLFPGLLPVAMMIVGVIAGGRQLRRELAMPMPGATEERNAVRRGTAATLATIALLGAVGALYSVSGLTKAFALRIPDPLLRLENHLIAVSASLLVLAGISSRARHQIIRVFASPHVLALICMALAWYLSLGPTPEANGRPVAGPRPYAWLLQAVPGWDGLRVPARYAMIAIMFLSLAAAWGLTAITKLLRAGAGVALFIVLLLWLGEAWTAPIQINGPIGSAQSGIGDPPPRVPNGTFRPPLARFLSQLPPSAVVAEFPFAAGGWELYYVYYSTLHWRRLVNGYSGYEPRAYTEVARELRDPYRNPQDAWRLLKAAGTTHVVVHGQAYVDRLRPAPYDWLTQSGARFVARIGSDEIYDVPR